MHRSHLSFLIVALLGLMGVFSLTSSADPASQLVMPDGRTRLVPLDEVRRGMRGVAKTTFFGQRVEEFDIEVLGLLRGAGPMGDLILIRGAGERLEESGGIASGMSGSPVYIGDRLLGAISYAFMDSEDELALVTPAESMLALLNLLPSEKDEGHWLRNKNPAPVVGQIATPVAASGFSRRGLRLLRQAFPGLAVAEEPGVVSGLAGPEQMPLEAGSACGLQLVRGDLNLAAVGTVTYVDDQYVLALGHSLTGMGSTEMFLTGAHVWQSVHSSRLPFKIASLLGVVGTIKQDRAAGVAAVRSRPPDTVLLKMDIMDRERGKTTHLEAELANHPQLVRSVIGSVVLSGLDRGLDRIGPGTAAVRFDVVNRGLEEEFTRENMFYSGSDVAAAASSELIEAVDLIIGNEYESVAIEEIRVTADVRNERLTARIEDATLRQAEVLPGEEFVVAVQVRPFRQPPYTEEVVVSVPETVAPGVVTLTVRAGGGYGFEGGPQPAEESPEERGGEPATGRQPEPESQLRAGLTGLLADFSGREVNNSIVVEFSPPFPVEEAGGGTPVGDEPAGEPAARDGEDNVPPPDGEASMGNKEADADDWEEDAGDGPRKTRFPAYPEPVQVRRPMSYVMQGSVSLDLVIGHPGPGDGAARESQGR